MAIRTVPSLGETLGRYEREAAPVGCLRECIALTTINILTDVHLIYVAAVTSMSWHHVCDQIPSHVILRPQWLRPGCLAKPPLEVPDAIEDAVVRRKL